MNVPELQAAYWLGGYQSRDTTPSITDDTRAYATGMIQFNTTTEVYTLLDAPFTPVQQGALVYLPTLHQGVLLYFGGEVPSVQDGIDAQLSPVRSPTPGSLQTNEIELMGLRLRI